MNQSPKPKASERAAERQARATARPWPASVSLTFSWLREVPWAPLTGITALVGAVVMFLYYDSIGHLRADLMTGTSVALFFALATFLGLGLLALLISMPAIAANTYASTTAEEKRAPFGPVELIGLQLLGMGGLLAWADVSRAEKCTEEYSHLLLMGGSLAVISLCIVCREYVRLKQRVRPMRLVHSALVSGSAIAPLLVVIPLQTMMGSALFDAFLLLLSVWLLFVIANAVVPSDTLRVGEILYAAYILTILLFVALPLGLERSGAVTAALAQAVGVRSDGPVQLIVEKRTCSIYARAFPAETPATSCELGEVSEIRAVVLSNVGERWILAPALAVSVEGVKASVTVPASDIQVVWTPKREEPRVCKASRG